MRPTHWPAPLSSRASALVVLGTLFTLLAPGCAGRCPSPTSEPVSVTPTRAPCQSSDGGTLPAGDPLTLVGGEGFIFTRFDVAGIRRSRYGARMERALDAFIRAEVRGPEQGAFRDGMARTEVIAIAFHIENGVTVVAQGRYTDADLDTLELTERRSRRQHVIHSARRHEAAIVGGRYLIIAERSGVEGVLDRLDGLEDPTPIGGPLLNAYTESGAYRAYFSMVGVPNPLFRREFEREEGLAGVFADLRWGALTVADGASGLQMYGRAHSITESAARAILTKSEETRQEAAVALDREVPALAAVARNLDMRVSGTDATLSLTPSEAEAEAIIDAVTEAFERDAQRRASYATPPPAVTAP
jgi:hypothetical protein